MRMRGRSHWLLTRRLNCQFSTCSARRFKTENHERVSVRCGSAGHMSIDLFNLALLETNSRLFIHLPPFPTTTNLQPTPLPDFLRSLPVAQINYQWIEHNETHTQEGSIKAKSVQWPLPIHQTALAYSWILENLAPEQRRRKDIYVYGSHLGASLAASLALTETYPHTPFGVRGLIAYNGIYNWTMFLPDHRIHKPSTRRGTSSSPSPYPPPHVQSAYLSKLQAELPALFRKPENMFDSFASPSLLFHRPGLLVPESFHISTEDAYCIDLLAKTSSLSNSAHEPPDLSAPLKQPRKSHLTFPPRISTLKLPPSLLLYDSPPDRLGEKRRRKPSGHTLEAQATELSDLMRRSMEKGEIKDRQRWDAEVDESDVERETQERIRTVNVGPETGNHELSGHGQQMILDWMSGRM